MMPPSPRSVRDAALNVTRKLLSGSLADLRPTPSDLIDQGPRHALYRYRPSGKVIPTGPPVLLVPPPAPAAAAAFDLRRGCSLAEHLVATGHRVYLLDHAPGLRSPREPRLETWVDEVLPRAVARVSRDVDGQPVQLVGWCLGGVLCVLAAAARPALPVASITSVAARIDADAARPAASAGVAHLIFGGISRTVAGDRNRIREIGISLTRPITMLTRLDDTDFLAQIEAVDAFTAHMSDRSAERLYERFFPGNALALADVEIAGRRVALADVRVPVLVIAGRDDRTAPWRTVHPLTRLLPRSPDVRFVTAPGGHLGVLSGRGARGTTWPRLDAWLAEGSVRHGLRAPRGQRERLASRS